MGVGGGLGGLSYVADGVLLLLSVVGARACPCMAASDGSLLVMRVPHTSTQCARRHARLHFGGCGISVMA